MRSNRSSNIDGPVAGEYFSRVRLLYQLSGPWVQICVLSDPGGGPKWRSGRERGTGAYVMALLPRGLKVHLALGYPSARSGHWRTEKNWDPTFSTHGLASDSCQDGSCNRTSSLI